MALTADNLDLSVLRMEGATPIAGFVLQNGTPNILSWTAPNDDQMHRFTVYYVVRVTSAETGGASQVTWNGPDGTAVTTALDPGGHGNGMFSGSQQKLIAPGSTVTVQQSSALTVGAALMWSELWGA